MSLIILVSVLECVLPERQILRVSFRRDHLLQRVSGNRFNTLINEEKNGIKLFWNFTISRHWRKVERYIVKRSQGQLLFLIHAIPSG